MTVSLSEKLEHLFTVNMPLFTNSHPLPSKTHGANRRARRIKYAKIRQILSGVLGRAGFVLDIPTALIADYCQRFRETGTYLKELLMHLLHSKLVKMGFGAEEAAQLLLKHSNPAWLTWPKHDDTTWYDANSNCGRLNLRIYAAKQVCPTNLKEGYLVRFRELSLFTAAATPRQAMMIALRTWRYRNKHNWQVLARRDLVLCLTYLAGPGATQPFTRRMSRLVGNCRYGTDAWIRHMGWERRDEVMGAELIPHLEDAMLRRVVLHAMGLPRVVIR